MQAFSDLLVGEVLEMQLHDLAVGVRQHCDYFPQQDQPLFLVSESFGGRPGSSYFREAGDSARPARVPRRITARVFLLPEGNCAATEAVTADVPGGVADDDMHPGASRGAAEAGLVDVFQNLDPTVLKGFPG